MGMMRVYALATNIHNNACESDNIDDVLNWVRSQIETFPVKTIVNIVVREIPTELFMAMPKFEGFKYGHSEIDIPGSD